jgi:Cu/Ag efflux protein CusF
MQVILKGGHIMAKKIVVTAEVIGKLDRSIITNKWTQEQQKAISVTLGNGDKVNFYENEATFHSVGQFLQQGDVMSFVAEKQSQRPWVDGEGANRTTTTLSGLTEIVVEQGAWSENPIEGLVGRQAAAADMFKVRVPRDTAAPIGGNAAFTADAAISGVAGETPVAGAVEI